ncbi:MAG: DEAD/DEAH box helicase [Nitrosomonas sp.]|nr:MAG: DEAD/DEAH box helicase [Nitrosomonas sp.]
MSFEQLGLSSSILKAVSEQGYLEPTPIQVQAIPVILAGKDVMGGAQTGTGKTASFVLPMLQRFEVYANSSMSPAKHPVRAVILTPTRELAMQVHESVKIYGKYSQLRSTVIYGGVNIESQVEAVRAGIEILVATPGRLLDHVHQKNLMFSKVELLILDEADRMLDMGFMPDLKLIIQLLPAQRQNLMFSATFSDEIKNLAGKILREPVLIEVAKRNSVSELITHVVYPVEAKKKQFALIQLIKQQNLQQVLVFTRTKLGADRLARFLIQQSITCAAIHGDRNQLQRTQALADFKQNTIRILVATDVAARGLDIEELTHVINFELPNNPEDYVHRIGRTGRAGSKGHAISLVSKDEETLLSNIEKLLGIKVSVDHMSENVISRSSNSSYEKSLLVKDRKEGKKPRQESKQHRNPKISVGVNARRTAVAKTGKCEDPLFTQPYVSKYPDLVSVTAMDGLGRKPVQRRFPERALPALFTSFHKRSD